jgi:GGDEF domain-containing protein
LAEAMRARIENQEGFKGLFDIGIGIAVAAADSACDDAENLVACADRALFQAKSSGRNRTEAVRLTAPSASKSEDGAGEKMERP